MSEGVVLRQVYQALDAGNWKRWNWKMEMETEMEKDEENGKGRQSDSIFNATK